MEWQPPKNRRKDILKVIQYNCQTKLHEMIISIHILGIDIAKNIFQLHGVNKLGKQIYSKRVRRDQLIETIVNYLCKP
jgi:hypothetical protein